MIVKPLTNAALLPTSSGSATTLSKAGVFHVYVAGQALGGGTTSDQDGVVIVIVDSQGGAAVSSIRLGIQESAILGKNPDQYIYAEGNVFATKIAYTN
jgi:hypothetical protein